MLNYLQSRVYNLYTILLCSYYYLMYELAFEFISFVFMRVSHVLDKYDEFWKSNWPKEVKWYVWPFYPRFGGRKTICQSSRISICFAWIVYVGNSLNLKWIFQIWYCIVLPAKKLSDDIWNYLRTQRQRIHYINI